MVILYYDVCAIIILLIVAFSTFVKGLNKDRTNYMFYVMLLFMLLAAVGDFCNAYISITYEPSEYYRRLCYIFNYVYFFAHNNILPVYVLFIYSNMGMWHRFKQSRPIRVCWICLTSIANIVTISNFFNKQVFYITENLEYERQPLIIVFYLCALAFMVFGLTVIIRFRQLVRRDKLIVMILLYPITLSGIIIQAFAHEMLIEMFTISIAALLFCIVIRRPEELLDPITGAKKYNVGYDTIRNILNTGMPVSIILVKITNYRNILLYLGHELYNTFLKNQTRVLKLYSKECQIKSDLYYLEDGLFAFVTEYMKEDGIELLANKVLHHYFEELTMEDFVVLADARVCTLQCPKDINEYSTLFTFGNTFHNTLANDKRVHRYSEYVNDIDFKIKNELDDIIARAINDDHLLMYYQPIYSTIEKRFVCAEALVRLRDDKYGMISPALFIKAAEISGAIHQIGDFVLEDVCRFVGSNDFEALGLSHVQINMSASQCIEVDLVDKINRLLSKYKLAASKINLEITESAADFDPVIVDQNINRLHELGINFALDDYGIGYSNVKRVTSLPIELVKLDKTFVDGIDDPQMWIMVQDTIKMLKEMHKEVLVEGVEAENIVERFMDLGCDYIQGCEYLQGYYFCKPLPEDEFLEFMKKQAV